MIKFDSLLAYQAYVKACTDTLSGNSFKQKIENLVLRDKPVVLRLNFPVRENPLGLDGPKYFDFGLFTLPVDHYQENAELSTIQDIPAGEWMKYRLFNGGLVLSGSVWGSHT